MDRLDRSFQYLLSWTDARFAVHGVIATYWDSSESATDPSVMNQFPILHGLRILHERFRAETAKDWSNRFAGFLLESFDRHAGLFRNAFGDAPGKPTTVVHQAAATCGLLDAYAVTGDEALLGAAIACLRQVRVRWPGPYLNGVHNQVLKYIDALARLRQFDPVEFARYRGFIARYRVVLSRFITHAAEGGELIDQSVNSSFLMSVYQAKCLHGLLALHEMDGDEWSRARIEGVVEGLISNLYTGDGHFLSHIDYEDSWSGALVRYGFAACRRLPLGAWNLDLEVLRRRIQRRLLRYDIHVGPVWIARLADTLFALKRAAHLLEGDIGHIVRDVDAYISRYTLPHGGVINASGPWRGLSGADVRTTSTLRAWQRGVCATRWNAYVFRWLCAIAGSAPRLHAEPCSSPVMWENDAFRYRETSQELFAECKGDGRRLTWSKPGITRSHY